MRRTATSVRVGLALGTLVLAAACGGASDSTKDAGSKDTGSAPKPGAQVHMSFTLFSPVDYTIKTGETLTFVNDNPIHHEIVEGTFVTDADKQRTSEKDDGAFKLTIPAEKGFTAEHTFTQAGKFTFFCTIHKAMNGSVTVT